MWSLKVEREKLELTILGLNLNPTSTSSSCPHLNELLTKRK
jgi:hypothetical protein